MTSIFLSWGIAACATAGVITRPFKWPEAVWAVAGAVLLVALGLLPLDLAIEAVGKGTDVYLFLFGMMLLSEVGRREGLFDWVAVLAVNHAQGSPRKLFMLVYLVGVVITAFLSNDATAVVLTPAVFAAAKKARTDPLPLLFVCAFIANAASFAIGRQPIHRYPPEPCVGTQSRSSLQSLSSSQPRAAAAAARPPARRRHCCIPQS